MRNYAIQLQKAYELATSLFNQNILEEEKRLAYEYDNEKANSAIILYNQETNQILRLPYYMRFKKEYIKEIRRKIWRDIYPQILNYKNFLFGTFEASTTKYYSQKDAHDKVQKFWNSLLTRIRREFPWVKIIKSVEWQKNGIGYHIHVLFCGVRYIDIEWIRDTWAKLEPHPRAVKLKPFNNPKWALAYLMKYITKTLRKSDEIPMSLIINWALRLRTISLSRNFRSHKTNSNEKSKSDWVFLGIMPLDLALSYTDTEILDYFKYG
jgi:hypothetical protein